MKLNWKIIIGLVLGIIWALISSSFGLTQFTLDWINPFGTIFINLLKLIAIPLVLFSIIKGVAELSDIKKLGAIGFKTLGLYIATTLFAVTVGLTLVNVLKPGQYISEELGITNRLSYELWVSSTEGVEISDNKNYLSNPDYAAYIEDAKASLNSVDNPLGDKVVTAKNAKEQRP